MTTTAKHLAPQGAMLSIPTSQATRTDAKVASINLKANPYIEQRDETYDAEAGVQEG